MYLIPTLFLCLSLGTIKKHVQFANGVTSFLYMSDAEMQRDGTLMIGGGIVATQQASQNFEQGMEAESQQQNLQRK